jgi:dTDP-4-dehydrorhamnose 3,5-epimerase
VHDVIVDLRPESQSFLSWFAIRLDPENRFTLYVPARFAHGYQVLVPDTEVSYAMSARYAPASASGIRFDDDTLGIDWPLAVGTVSARDLSLPSLASARDELVRRFSV